MQRRCTPPSRTLLHDSSPACLPRIPQTAEEAGGDERRAEFTRQCADLVRAAWWIPCCMGPCQQQSKLAGQPACNRDPP